jgi:hypothetical protein
MQILIVVYVYVYGAPSPMCRKRSEVPLGPMRLLQHIHIKYILHKIIHPIHAMVYKCRQHSVFKTDHGFLLTAYHRAYSAAVRVFNPKLLRLIDDIMLQLRTV